MSAVPYFDAHCDTLTAVYEHGGGLFENAYQLDLSRLSAYSPCAQVFAVWNGDFEAKAALLRRECAARPGLVSFCRTPGEARDANAEARCSPSRARNSWAAIWSGCAWRGRGTAS